MTERPPGGPRLRISHGQRVGDVRVIRRRRRRGLERVLGVPGLFSAAYGNVGSSIYYALGVTALYALGLTPLVFVISGVFFLFTALTYAEGTAAMPEAGGSTTFARRAFGEGFSFIVGWAQILNYVVTIAISAFAVPNYLSVFWPALKTFPATSSPRLASPRRSARSTSPASKNRVVSTSRWRWSTWRHRRCSSSWASSSSSTSTC